MADRRIPRFSPGSIRSVRIAEFGHPARGSPEAAGEAFIWNVHDMLWEEPASLRWNFRERLAAECPCRKGGSRIGSARIRTRMQKGTIRRIVGRLEALGFEWEIDLSAARFGANASLLAYKAVHGHCRVSKMT